MYQSVIKLQRAWGHILPRSASLSWLPACSPACIIPCQSNLAGNLEGATASRWGGCESIRAWLLFGLFSSCRGSAAPLHLLYAPLSLSDAQAYHASCRVVAFLPNLSRLLLHLLRDLICSSWLPLALFVISVCCVRLCGPSLNSLTHRGSQLPPPSPLCQKTNIMLDQVLKIGFYRK